MKARVYNLEFPSYCPEFSIGDYRFTRDAEYPKSIVSLQHLVTSHSEFFLTAVTGSHAHTAWTDLPDNERPAQFSTAGHHHSELDDVLLLLSLVTCRDVFAVRDEGEPLHVPIIIADSRLHPFGGSIRAGIPFRRVPGGLGRHGWFNGGFQEGMNSIFETTRDSNWRKKYGDGRFLVLALNAFRRQAIESSFIQCWTLWEHLFAVHNRHWISANNVEKLRAIEKVAFIYSEYIFPGQEVDDLARDRIAQLAKIRNRLVHFGIFPEKDTAFEEALLFVELTEIVVARSLGIEPGGALSTIDRLQNWLRGGRPRTPWDIIYGEDSDS